MFCSDVLRKYRIPQVDSPYVIEMRAMIFICGDTAMSKQAPLSSGYQDFNNTDLRIHSKAANFQLVMGDVKHRLFSQCPIIRLCP